MREKGVDELGRWLEAESDGSWEEADALFATLAGRHLPKLAPSRDLVAAVMAAVPRPRANWPAWGALNAVSQRWVRSAVVASLVVLGLALALATGVRYFEVAAGAVEAAARLAHVASTTLAAAIGVLLAVWTLVASLGRAAALVATTGSAQALIVANLLLASAAFAGLSRLLAPREEFK